MRNLQNLLLVYKTTTPLAHQQFFFFFGKKEIALGNKTENKITTYEGTKPSKYPLIIGLQQNTEGS